MNSSEITSKLQCFAAELPLVGLERLSAPTGARELFWGGKDGRNRRDSLIFLILLFPPLLPV